MVNVFAPMKVNSFVIDFRMESMAVRIPTNAVIPTAMIIMVSTVLKRFERSEWNATLKFSEKNVYS
jgi:RNA polymerase-interacting CarD/CdnL/TRCF family regulator